MPEEKRELPDHVKQEAAKVYMSITCHSPLKKLGHIEREHIEQVIGEAIGGWQNLAKDWEKNYWALKKERDDYRKALEKRSSITEEDFQTLLNKY